MKVFLFILLLVISLRCEAEVNEQLLKSLEADLINTPEKVIEEVKSKINQNDLSDSMRLQLQVILAEALVQIGDSNQSVILAKAIVLEAETLGFINIVGKGLHRQASAYLYLGDFKHALEKYQQALVIFNDSEDQNMMANALMGIGNVYGQLGELEQALNYYLQSLQIMQKLENGTVIGGLYNNIGSIQFWLKDYASAINYYERSIAFSLSIGDTKELAVQYSNVGEAYTELADYPKALKYFEIALSYVDESASPYSKTAIHLPLGKLKLKLDKPKEALAHFDKVIGIAEKNDAQDWLAEALLGKALTVEDLNLAITLGKQALLLSEKINKTVFVIQAHELLATLYVKQANYREAYNHSQSFHNLQEKLVQQDGQSELLRLSAMLELEQKNHKIELLEKDKVFNAARVSEEKFRNNIIVACLLLLIITLFTFYRHHIQRRQSEKERQVADTLRRLDKIKDQFLANTSHELRTPLNAIIGLSSLVLDTGVSEHSTDELNEIHSLIHQSGEKLLLLVNDILDFTAIKENKLRLKLEPVALKTIIDDLIREVEYHKIGKEVVIDNLVDEFLPALKADRQRLQQILLNLIDNAIKFTAKGKITLNAKIMEHNICILIEDTGIGIAHDFINLIFERFEQVDGSSQRQYGGTGLGLAIVKELVDLHQGSIQVISKEGVGTRFEILIPIWQA